MECLLVADALAYTLPTMDIQTVSLAPIAREALEDLSQATISASLQLGNAGCVRG
jgi:hypothetical protein